MNKVITGTAIKLAMLKYEISKEEASKALNLSVLTIRNQCNAKDLKLSTVTKYAELCGIKASELIALSE